MRWFEGGIAEAITTSKAKNAIFVVFVEGQDEASRTVSSSVDAGAVSTVLESEDFVAIKLESTTEAYRQFAQIYQLVPVPSIFFIGENGAPLEVVAGEVNETELLQRISGVLEKSGRQVKQESTTVLPPAQEARAASPDTSNSASESNVAADVAAIAEAMKMSQSEVSASDVLSKEEKVERAKELLEVKRKQKQEEEEQKERMKELERRKTGQDVQKLRRWQQDQELKQLKEERQREKLEEAAARERILKQIAEDRAERAARFGEKKTSPEPSTRQPSEQEVHERSASTIARIQFRMPDGSAHTHNFDPATTLEELRTYAATQLNLPFREFSMSTSFPRREFTARDNSQTLRDLQLMPTAVILILPSTSGSVVSSSSPSFSIAVSRMVWSLLTPFFSLLNYLRSLVFGGGGGGGSGARVGGSSSTHESSPAGGQTSSGVKRRKTTAETSIHRHGNIHRLSNHRDSSDDENNTWNGNSTQQM